ncbi:MAG: ribosome silencing factor [Verrucomicrobiae bacterium]|nr:ribosome silencing factor [Verrucomicrobiae bacterium]
MDSRQLALTCMELADNRKAEKIVALDVRKLTSVADYFIICSGLSEPHLKAIINEIRDHVFKKHGVHPRCMDGMVGTSWVVLDYYDVVVHVMRDDTRQRYDLESFWGDAVRLSLKDKEAFTQADTEAEKPARKTKVKAAASKKTTIKKTTTKKVTKASGKAKSSTKKTAEKTAKKPAASKTKKATTKKEPKAAVKKPTPRKTVSKSRKTAPKE